MIAAKVFDLENKLIPNIENTVSEWQSFGITDAFVLENFFKEERYQTAINNTDINSWVIVQTLFNNDNNLSSTPNNPLFAITQDGKIAKDKEWLEMVCPNGGPNYSDSNNYRLNLIKRVKKLVSDFHPYGISLDFMRYFVYWEKVYEDTDPNTLLNSCFCDRCLSLFSEENSLTIPESLITTSEKSEWILNNHKAEWTNFKTKTITDLVKEIIDSVAEIAPNTKFNLHGVPWREADFNGAIKNIAGQDIKELGKILNYISPMCYAKMLHREPAWINELVSDFAKQTSTPIIPVFQVEAMYGTDDITDEEFESYLVESLKSPSSGVAFWPWESLTDSQKEIMKRRLIK